jgi:hypothetical protein
MVSSGLVLAVLGMATVLTFPVLSLLNADWDDDSLRPDHESPRRVKFTNSTPQTLWIYDREGEFQFELVAFESRSFSRYFYVWDPPMVAKTENGRVVSRIDLTRDELKAQGYRIVIQERGEAP